MQRRIPCLALACLLAAAFTASAARPGCVCTALYDPVCGEDGKGYSNSCQADCAGVPVAYSGSCQTPPSSSTGLSLPGLIGSIFGTGSASADDCMCTKQYNPVCGDDGLTYPNQCQATCAGTSVAEDGACGAAVTTTAATGKTPAVASVTQEDAPTVKATSVSAPALTPPPAAPAPAPAAATKAAAPRAAGPAAATGSGRKPGCICAALYMPVCGEDRQTYSNSCDADCAGVAVAAQGRCDDTVSTADTGAALTNTTDAAPDAALPAATELQPEPSADGAASSGCVCTAVYEPVCGEDGKDYSNSCEAGCAGVAVLRKGPCSSSSLPADSSDSSSSSTGSSSVGSCQCPMIYAPVCTKKGATRSNKCVAQCKGENVAYEGACKPKTTDAPIVDELEAKDNATVTAAAAPSTDSNPTAVQGIEPAAAAALDAPEDCSKPCSEFYMPVCGADGSTYANGCVAKCSGKTTVAKEGACPGSTTAKSSGAAHSSSSAGAKLLAAAFSAVWLVGMLL